MKQLSFLTAGLVILLQACTTPLNTSLSAENKSYIQTAHAHNGVVQDEVIPAVVVSNSSTAAAASGGLLGLVIASNIDASANKRRNKNAHALIEALWDNTLDYDYRQMSSDILEATLAEHMTLANPGQSSRFVGLSKHELIAEINQLEAGKVFTLFLPRYAFVDNSKRLQTLLEARIYKKSETEPNKVPKPIYNNAFFVESATVGEGGESSMTLWNENEAALFKQTAKNNIEALAALLSYDLNNPDESCSPSQTVVLENILTNRNLAFKGKQVNTLEGLHAVRNNTGFIYATRSKPAKNIVPAKC